jgi:hypothetical protein
VTSTKLSVAGGEAGPTTESDRRVATQGRLAGGGLVLVLLSVSVFVVWSSQATGTAATRAVAANKLSDDYARAGGAQVTAWSRTPPRPTAGSWCRSPTSATRAPISSAIVNRARAVS